MIVARHFLLKTVLEWAFWASTSGWAEDLERTLLDTSRTRLAALAPAHETSKAHLRACLFIARPRDHFICAVLAFLTTMLGLAVHNEPSVLLTTTASCRALRPLSELTRAVNWAWTSVFTRLSVTLFVAVRALLATIGSWVCDGIEALCDTISTRCGALAKLTPGSFTVLRAALLIARLLLLLAMRMRALGSTVLGRHVHSVFPFRGSSCTIVAAVSALLRAITPSTPGSFTIDWARLCVAGFVFHVLMFDGAFQASMLCMDFDFVSARAAATTTGGAAVAPCSPITLAIDWARGLAACF